MRDGRSLAGIPQRLPDRVKPPAYGALVRYLAGL